MAENQERIAFTTEEGEVLYFYVLEQTTINGVNYLLVADGDEEDEEANALILKETAQKDMDDLIYEIVDNEKEMDAIAKVFEEILDDIELETI